MHLGNPLLLDHSVEIEGATGVQLEDALVQWDVFTWLVVSNQSRRSCTLEVGTTLEVAKEAALTIAAEPEEPECPTASVSPKTDSPTSPPVEEPPAQVQPMEWRKQRPQELNGRPE